MGDNSSSSTPPRQYSFLASLIAGGMAGMAVDISLYPLDTIKTRLQVHAFPPILVPICLLNYIHIRKVTTRISEVWRVSRNLLRIGYCSLGIRTWSCFVLLLIRDLQEIHS